MFGKLISERLARANLTAQCRPFSSDECELAVNSCANTPPLWKYSRSYSYTLGILCPTSATHYVDVSLSHTRDSYSAHSAPCEHARTNRMRSERDTIGADSCSSRARGWGRLIRAGDPGETFSLRRLIIPTRRLLQREPSPRMVQKFGLHHALASQSWPALLRLCHEPGANLRDHHQLLRLSRVRSLRGPELRNCVEHFARVLKNHSESVRERRRCLHDVHFELRRLELGCKLVCKPGGKLLMRPT